MLAYLIDGVDMEYRTLGRSGLRISRLSLGAMTFGAGSGIWGEIAGLDRAQAARLVAVAAEQGINFIDTADAYSQGKSEEVVGQVLSDLGLDETRMLVATKVRLRTGPGPNEVGLGRSHIIRSVERSLKRIRRDHIDLFQLHDRDALVPIEETLRSLDDLVTQGKVRHARTEAQLEDNLSAQRLILSGTQRDGLDRVSQPEVTYPHWMQQFHDKDRILN
jgi:aryl-alcohol dehydrogenase-like predicted oxidoreductase